MFKVQSKRSEKIKKIAILAVFLLLLLLILNLFQKEVRSFTYSISSPVQKALWKTGNNFSGFIVSFFKAGSLKKENDEIKTRNQELLARIASLEESKRENEILRQALEIGLEKDFKLVLTSVIGKDASQDFILIDKGFEDGVSKDDPVITSARVLVGRISEVYRKSSKVMLVSNKKSALNAEVIERNVSGVIKGEGGQKIIFDLIPREEELSNGDVVVSNGLEGVFPKGIVVGQVSDIKKDDTSSFQQVEVKYGFDIKRENALFIIVE
jgi:rod shape-determining protein MreC